MGSDSTREEKKTKNKNESVVKTLLGASPRFTVTSRNLFKVSLSNPQISMKLRSNAAAIFPAWTVLRHRTGRALPFQTFKETALREAAANHVVRAEAQKRC